jgi:Electron transfer DM13
LAAASGTVGSISFGCWLELTDLRVAAGAPDVRLYLTAHAEGTIDDTAIDLGHVPDRTPTIAATIPPGTDVARVSTVAVHCKVYSVDFGHGALTPTGATT